jgi:hypothetical protein
VPPRPHAVSEGRTAPARSLKVASAEAASSSASSGAANSNGKYDAEWKEF